MKSTNSYVSKTCIEVVTNNKDKLSHSSTLYKMAEVRVKSPALLGPSSMRSLSRGISMGDESEDVLCGQSVEVLYPKHFPDDPCQFLFQSRLHLQDIVVHSKTTEFKDKSEVVLKLRKTVLATCKAILGEYLERQKILVQHGAMQKLQDLTEERKIEVISKGGSNQGFTIETSLIKTFADRPYAAEIGLSFLLESKIVQLCFERGITHKRLEDVIEEWQTLFSGTPLSLIVKSHVPVVARWLKWGLLINNLRQVITERFPPAIGIVGLVNSGKTKLINTLFGINVSIICHNYFSLGLTMDLNLRVPLS